MYFTIIFQKSTGFGQMSRRCPWLFSAYSYVMGWRVYRSLFKSLACECSSDDVAADMGRFSLLQHENVDALGRGLTAMHHPLR